MGKFARRVGWGFGTLVLLLVLFILVEHIRGRRVLTACIQELYAKGEKLTLEELDLPRAPKEGKGVPAFHRAADQLMALQDQCPIVTFPIWTAKPLRTDSTRLLLFYGALAFNSRSKESQHARDDRINAFNDRITWAELAKEVKVVEPMLAQARKSLQDPIFVMNVDHSRGTFVTVDHHNKIRVVARVLSAAALHDIHQRHLEGALESIQALVQLGYSLDEEPTMTSQALAAAISSVATAATWEALQLPGWHESQLELLQRAFQSRDTLPDMVRGLEWERASCWALLHLMPCSVDVSWNLRNLFDPTNALDVWCPWLKSIAGGFYRFLWRMAWREQDLCAFLKIKQCQIEFTRSLMRQEKSAMEILDWDRHELGSRYGEIGQSKLSVMRHPVTLLTVPSYARWMFLRLRLETQREMVVAAIALKRYQLRHGKFPADLAALTPEFLTKLPHDFMNGKPLHYHPGAHGSYLLYSVGTDGVDQGGNPMPPPRKDSKSVQDGTIWEGRDAVWPAPAAPAP